MIKLSCRNRFEVEFQRTSFQEITSGTSLSLLAILFSYMLILFSTWTQYYNRQMLPILMTTKGIQTGQVTHGSILNFTPPYTVSYNFWLLRYIKAIKQLHRRQMLQCTCPRLAWQLFESLVFAICVRQSERKKMYKLQKAKETFTVAYCYRRSTDAKYSCKEMHQTRTGFFHYCLGPVCLS